MENCSAKLVDYVKGNENVRPRGTWGQAVGLLLSTGIQVINPSFLHS